MFYTVLLIILLLITSLTPRFSFNPSSNSGKFYYFLLNRNIIFLIIISFFISIRYNIGTDWEGYVNHYNLLMYTDITFNNQPFEFGYYFIANLFASSNLSYQLFFFSISFISWSFITSSIDKKILPYFVFVLFAIGLFFWSLSGIRQFIAMAIFIYSLKYFYARDIWNYMLLSFFAFLFHQSAFLLFFIYFVPLFRDIGRSIYIILFLITSLPIIFSEFDISLAILQSFTEYTNIIIDRYQSYIDQGRIFYTDLDNLGLGFWLLQLLTFILLWYGYELKYKDRFYILIYNLFSIGAILFNIFYSYELVNRILIYPKMCMAFLFSVLLYYWSKDKIFTFQYFSVIILFLIYFVALIFRSASECCPYNFYL